MVSLFQMQEFHQSGKMHTMNINLAPLIKEQRELVSAPEELLLSEDEPTAAQHSARAHQARLLEEQVLAEVSASILERAVHESVLQDVIPAALNVINEQQLMQQAIKLVCKGMLKSVTKKCTSRLVQESTDAICQMEDDSITLADFVLRSTIRDELLEVVLEADYDVRQLQAMERRLLGESRDSEEEVDIPSEHDFNRSGLKKSVVVEECLEDLTLNESVFLEAGANTNAEDSLVLRESSRGLDVLKKSAI